jgi:hypothetical protein
MIHSRVEEVGVTHDEILHNRSASLARAVFQSVKL